MGCFLPSASSISTEAMKPSRCNIRARDRFVLEAGTRTDSCLTWMAFRTLVNMSDIGSVKGILCSCFLLHRWFAVRAALPEGQHVTPSGDNRWPPHGGTGPGHVLEARLPDSGKLTPEGQRTETYAAHSDESDVAARPSTSLTPVVELHRVLHRARRQLALVALPLLYFCFLSQMGFPDLLKG